MESIGLIQKQKRKISEYFVGDILEERPNAFTDLQDDEIRAVNNTSEDIWSALFVEATKKTWIDF